MKILLIDFYDSFTFNLKHYLETLHQSVEVIRHDEINDINVLSNYSHIILSPGPGMPKHKSNMFECINYCDAKIPLLGICLGMQAIGQYLGGELKNMKEVKHGVSENIVVSRGILFDRLPARFNVGLYHSWVLEKIHPKYVDAVVEHNGYIMGISDQKRKLFGVQFHPESVLSEYGIELLSNFLNQD
jgi:anthranilate synthase component 2